VLVEDSSVKARRLILSARTRTILKTGLELLGIQPLERM
ncbi:MAG: DALR anticodon-binding domain-containing protein, partial [Verrucomicrobiota bacterium]|nr:DALR anticodon-binding domain-containing protein [Verrucomicrobiota bacterium]